jgi:50S ribosomal subunit-associated GTPase HflX
VDAVLEDLQLGAKACLKVFNKRDRVAPDVADALAGRHAAVAISARDRTTLAPLIERMQSMIAAPPAR